MIFIILFFSVLISAPKKRTPSRTPSTNSFIFFHYFIWPLPQYHHAIATNFYAIKLLLSYLTFRKASLYPVLLQLHQGIITILQRLTVMSYQMLILL